MRTTIVIAEPNESIRFGLRTILECDANIAILAEAKFASETISLTKEHKPLVLLLEWRMPDRPTAELLSRISKSSRRTKILIVSNWNEAEFEAPLKYQDLVSGYVWKHESEHLLAAVRQVATGRRFISPFLCTTLRKKSKKQRPARP